MYSDGHGENKQAQSAQTSAIVDVPGTPRDFKAGAGDGQVSLSWKAPLSDGGSAITGYKYRHKAAGGSYSEWTTTSTKSATVSSLTNGTEYTFEVRAVNRYGDGTAASASATPQAPVCSPSSFTATAGNKQVALSWSAPSGSNCATVTGYSYRYKAAGGSWSDWSSSSTATTQTVSSLTNGQHYTFEVRTVAGQRTSTGVSKSATPQAPTDTKGSVSLSTTAPQVGGDLTATLTDPDNPTNVQFTWSYHRPSGASGANGDVGSPSASVSATLRVSTVLLGLRILSTVSYTDDHGRQQARSDTTSAVVGPPWAPQSFTATAGNRQVALSWSAPSKLGGAVLTRYESRYKKTSGSSWSSWTSAGTATSQTVSSLTNGTPYSFEVRAVNSYGAGTAASASATPQAPVCSPSSFTATAGNKQVALSWSAPSGTNCAPVTGYEYRYKASGGSWSNWTSAGTATSKTATGLTNGTTYSFEVRTVASHGTSTAASASATPVQPDTPGSIRLSPNPPQAGGQVTATLSDADGSISRVLWSWAYFGVAGASDETETETETVSGEAAASVTRTFTVRREKVGYSLQVSATYTDGYGSGRRAKSAKSLPITAPPPVVCSLSSLSASAGNGQVSLSWSTPSGTNCASVTRYEYRYKKAGGSWLSWSSTGTSTSQTVTGLTNGVSYSFEVHAVTTQGTSSSVSASATPRAPPPAVCSPSSLSASAGNKQVSLSWSAPSGNCARVTRYEYRYKKAGGSWLSWSSTGTSTSQTVTGLTNGVSYSFEVHAVTAQGTSSSVSASATPVQPNTSGTVSLSPTTPQAGSSITATLSDPDTPITVLWWSLGFQRAAAAEGQSELVEEQAVEGANGSRSNTWRVSSTWVGWKLQARVSYTDAFGSQRASSSYTSAVTAAPPKDTPGTVSLSPDPPRVGSGLTATLSDPDTPIRIRQWSWFSRTPSAAEGESEWVEEQAVEGANGSLSRTRTVSNTLVGQELWARVSYTDAFGSQTASSAYSSPVTAASGTVQDEAEEEPAVEGPAEEEPTEEAPAVEGPAEEEPTEEAPAAKVALPDAALAALAAPNPFNPHTTLHVQLPARGPVRLTLYNVAGQVVLTLVDTPLEAGYHTFYWDGRDQHGRPVTSGVYLYRLTAGPHVRVGKMALIR